MLTRRSSIITGILILVLFTQFTHPTNTAAATPCNWIRFIADVSIPDGSIFKPGDAFTKTWQLKNNGSCTWTTAYSLVFESGALLGAPTSMALPRSVAPGQTINLSLPMIAPATAGSYRGFWKLQDAQGLRFGIGNTAASPIWVDIKVITATPITPTPTPAFTPTPGALGLNLQGTVRLNGTGLANVRIYRRLAGYSETLIATTGADGKYKAGFVYIPGDEMITIRPALSGFVFTPATNYWRHYYGLENKVLDFTASFAPPPPDPIVIDFMNDICAARWVSGAGTLPCPMTKGDARGYAVREEQPSLEDGTSSLESGLLVAPQNKYNGYIQGFFPEYTVVAGDRFQASIGCAFKASCYVTFRLDYQIGSGPLKILWSRQEMNEGKIYNAMINLNALAGKKVKFVLTLLSTGPATNDRAMWGQPRITREKSLWPTITPTATPDLPKVTSISAEVRYPATVVCGGPNPVGVYANVSTNGAANVTYYLEMDGVRTTPDQLLVFTTASTQTLEFGSYNLDCGDHTVRLVTTAPNFWSGLTYFSIPRRGFTDTPMPSLTPSATPEIPVAVLPIYNFANFEKIGTLSCIDVSRFTWTPQTCNGESGGCMLSQIPLFGVSQAGFLRQDGNTICGLNLP